MSLRISNNILFLTVSDTNGTTRIHDEFLTLTINDNKQIKSKSDIVCDYFTRYCGKYDYGDFLDFFDEYICNIIKTCDETPLSTATYYDHNNFRFDIKRHNTIIIINNSLLTNTMFLEIERKDHFLKIYTHSDSIDNNYSKSVISNSPDILLDYNFSKNAHFTSSFLKNICFHIFDKNIYCKCYVFPVKIYKKRKNTSCCDIVIYCGN